MNRGAFAGLVALAVSLFASAAPAELIVWLKPIGYSDTGTIQGFPNVEIYNTYDSGGIATSNPAMAWVGNLGVIIRQIPTLPQTITFKVIATVHGTNSVTTDDQMGSACFDILNSAWIGSGRPLLVGTPSPLTLTAGLGGVGSCPGALAATDLTGDIAPDLGGSFDTGVLPGSSGPWVKPYNATGSSTDGRVASSVDAHYTNLDVGTFTYTYDSSIAHGDAAQLQVKTIYTSLTGANFMAFWHQDSTTAAGAKKDYSGYKGTNFVGGPAVPILVRVPCPGPPDSYLSVNSTLPNWDTVPIDLGRVMKGTTRTKNVNLHNLSFLGTAADWTAVAPGDAYGLSVSPPAGSALPANSDLSGGLTVALDTSAGGVATGALSSAYKVIVTNVSSPYGGTTASVTGTVVAQRGTSGSVLAAAAVQLGVVHTGADLSGTSYSASVATTGDDSHYTRVLVGGSANPFNGDASTNYGGGNTGARQFFAVPGPASVARSGTLATLPVISAEAPSVGDTVPYAPVVVSYGATLYSGHSKCTAPGGEPASWAAPANWTDANDPKVHAVPGTFAGFNDRATLDDSSVAATVTLDGVVGHIAALVFDRAAKYTLAAGAGGSLALDNGPGTAQVTVLRGSHEISAPVVLNSDVQVRVQNAADRLTLSGGVSGTAGLTKTGSGVLALSGANAIAGPTTISGGGLVLDGGTLASANGISLAVGCNLAGSGTVAGDFKNHGQVTGDGTSLDARLVFDSPWTVSGEGTFENTLILGTYTPGNSPAAVNGTNQGFGGTVQLELGGATPGNGDGHYDQINDSASVLLTGSPILSILPWNGFLPEPGEQFEVLTWQSGLNGTFGSFEVDPWFMSQGIWFDVAYHNPAGSGGLTLTAVNATPEPSSLFLLAAGAVGWIGCFARRRWLRGLACRP